MEDHALPGYVAYFSVVSYPEMDRLSTALRPGFRSLADVDARNDGQVIALDHVIPGSDVLRIVNADHWAVTRPIARTHPWLAAASINRNDSPREILLEAILKYVDMAVGVHARSQGFVATQQARAIRWSFGERGITPRGGAGSRPGYSTFARA